jgi:PAS domain S-box-containing protein
MNPATSFFDESDARRIETGVSEVLRGKNIIITADLIAKDGRRTPMEFLGSLAKDAEGNPLYFISIGRNITERKLGEEALKASEEKYRDLVEKVNDVIYTIEADGRITYVNSAIESLIGLTPEQVVGQPFTQFVHPEDLKRLAVNMQRLLSGQATGSNDYRLLTTSGEIRWVRINSQPTWDGERIAGLRGVLTDITERKKLMDQLEENATSAERQRLARELHDSVTQTLYSIDLFSNAAQQALSAGKTDVAREHAHQVHNLSQSALADMRSLIFELRPPLLEQEGLVNALRMRLEMVESRAGIETNMVVDDEVKLSSSMENELYAIAIEALNNSLKHASAKHITVQLNSKNNHTCLIITDDGHGFDLETAERAGGFGLRNMRERVELISGSISLDTSLGKGTTVRVEVTV